MRDDRGRFVKGHKKPKEWRDRISVPMKDSTKKKISSAHKGKIKTEEHRDNLRDAILAKNGGKYMEKTDIDRRAKLKTRYGLTKNEIEKIFYLQNGKCAICGMDEKDNKKRLAIDHCHETNKVRGLLCTRCNLGLGFFMDSVENLSYAIEYLKENGR